MKKQQAEIVPTEATKTLTSENKGAAPAVEKYDVTIPLPAVTQKPAKVEVNESDLRDPETCVIKSGATCKRKGCGYVFIDQSCREKECNYHPGGPVFHEGSKGWSCCSRKVLEFDEFMKIKGCTTGKHRFLVYTFNNNQDRQECRFDHYQTPSSIIISVFCKNVDKDKSTIEISSQNIKMCILFKDGQEFKYDSKLYKPVDISKSKFEILTTKIEISLVFYLSYSRLKLTR